MICAAITLVVSILIIPISVRGRIFISLNDKKMYYSMFLYENLRLNSGYIRYKNRFLIINYTDKKAFAVPIKKLIPTSGFNANLIRFEPLKIKSSLLIGKRDFNEVAFALTLNKIHFIIYSLLKVYKPYADYKGDVFLSESGENGALFDLKFGFCVLILIEMAAKKFIGSILNYAKRKV